MAVDTLSLSVAQTVLGVCQKIRQSRNLWSGTLWKQQLLETLLMLVSMKVWIFFLIYLFDKFQICFSFWFEMAFDFTKKKNCCFGFGCSVCTSKAVCETSLLCELCHPLQGCEEQVKRGQENQGTSTAIPTSPSKFFLYTGNAYFPLSRGAARFAKS